VEGAVRRGFFAAACCALISCSDSTGGDTPNTTIAVSPSTLALTDGNPTATLFLTTTPSGGRLNWQVSRKPSWLTVNPTEGVVSGVLQVAVTATVPAEQEPGSMFGLLEIVSSGGVASVPVQVTVAAAPKLTISVTSLTIPAAVDTQVITLRNTGRGALSWSAAASATWLATIPEQGFVPTGDSTRLQVVPNRGPLPAGNSTATVTFTSTGTPPTTALPVTVSVAPAPKALLRVSRVVFTGSSTRSVYLINAGKGTLDWNVSAKESWLTTSPSAGAIPPADSIRIDVTANASTAPAVPTSGSITIASNSVDASSVQLGIDLVGAAQPLGVRNLDHRVVDAEFSVASGLLLTVSESPARLNVFDVETGASWFVDLPKAACCVSVRSDGRYAVVAHDALLSYIDLTTKQLVKSITTTTDAIDVVLATNGYAYVFPLTDQWVEIHGVNLATGTESNGTTIFAGTRAKLHPAGDFIYGVWFLSPADIQKYDIRAGRPSGAGDSPYHGDYPIGYNLWMSQDGAKIFTEAGRVFRTSTVASQDMLYAGRLAGIEGARSISDSPTRARVYALGTATQIDHTGVPPDVRTAELRLYDSATLGDRGQVALPRMTVNGQQADADGYYIFADGHGSRVYVLLKAVPSAGFTNDWALLTLDATALP
jgi:hypothetical protein